jgi:hypothetical protein
MNISTNQGQKMYSNSATPQGNNTSQTTTINQSNTTSTNIQSTSYSQKTIDLPEVRAEQIDINEKAVEGSNFTYIPKMVDQSIRLPVKKTDQIYNKVKQLIDMHMEYSSLELDFHKLGMAKDHVEAAIYYLRNIE